jgi:peptidoglycan/LPS O-acetylase OafA/YrhL
VGAVVFADTSGTAERIRAAARHWMFPVGLALVVALLVLYGPETPSIDHVMHPPHMQTLLALGFLAMVLGLWQTDNRWVLGFFNFAPFRFLGKISYGLYLIHLFMWPFEWLSRIRRDTQTGGCGCTWTPILLRGCSDSHPNPEARMICAY